MEHRKCIEVRTQTNIFEKRDNSAAAAGIFAPLTPCYDPHSLPYAVSHLSVHIGATGLQSYLTVTATLEMSFAK
jgi:hypothetical protein